MTRTPRYAAGRARALGLATRGTTAPNRLRRVDRWLTAVHGDLLRGSADPPLVIDLGYGSSPVTAVELHARLRAVRADTEVVGLEIGADDYVTKPYSPRELVARIRAVLRRQTTDVVEVAGGTLAAGPVRMDVERHVVTVDGAPVQLPLKEFELLELLLRNPGRVLTRMQLIDRVWGSDYVGDTKTLDVHVKRLRSKIEPDPAAPRHLVTVRGLGYKFEP